METIVYKDRGTWLKQRSTYLGGSELTTILGIDDYRSPYDLWLLKTGREQPNADNKHTLSGRFLEDGVAKYWEYESGHKLIAISEETMVYKHPEYSFLGGSPDRRFFWNGNGRFSDRAVLEVKTTMKIIDYDDIPYSWFLQPNFYTGLLGYKKFVIVWFEFFTKELKWQEYDFNNEMYDLCVDEAGKFWNNHIVADVPPELTTASDISKVFPNSKDGKSIIASDEVLELYSLAIDKHREKSAAEKAYKVLADQVKVIMKDSEYLLAPNMDILFTFKSGSRSRTLRIKELA